MLLIPPTLVQGSDLWELRGASPSHHKDATACLRQPHLECLAHALRLFSLQSAAAAVLVWLLLMLV